MTDCKPGTVAVATVRGQGENVRVVYCGGVNIDRCWLVPETCLHVGEDWVTDIRPLVVLDVEDPLEFAADLRWSHEEWNSRHFDKYAKQIEDQADVKPARIPEPGLGVHVNAGKPDGTRAEFVRVGSRHWSEIGTGAGWEWADLRDPVLVS